MAKVKLAVIGVGGMGGNHLGSIGKLANAELVAVCDIDKEKADRLAAEHGVKAFYSGTELFAAGIAEAVLIATPHYDHTTLSVEAFKAGLHVLVEKPIAVHKADAIKMIEAHAKRPELKFAAMFNQRTIPAHKKIKELIDKGELGEIRRVNWIITNWFRSQTYYNSGGWRATWKGEGGGVLLNQCPHQLDLFQWFFGLPTTVRAFCEIGKWHNIEVEDDVTCYCKFANGATGVFVTTTGDAPGTNRLEITADNGKLVYENGKITFTRNEVSLASFTQESKTGFGVPAVWHIDIPSDGGNPEQHQDVIDNFCEAILNDTPLIAPAEEGIKSVEFGNSMLYSSLKDTTVEMPLDANAYEVELKNLIANSTFVKPDEVKPEAEDFNKSFTK